MYFYFIIIAKLNHEHNLMNRIKSTHELSESLHAFKKKVFTLLILEDLWIMNQYSYYKQ